MIYKNCSETASETGRENRSFFFKNCNIQNGRSNMAAKIFIFYTLNSILPIGVFWGAESESGVKIAKFEMANPIWRQKF